MAERAPAYMQAIGLGAIDDRLQLESAWGVGAEGIITPTSFKLTSGGGSSNMSVTCASGRGIVHSDLEFGGSYHVVSDGVKAMNLSASSGSQYRRDAIIARIRDISLVPGDGDSSFNIEPVVGAFSASSNPPLPAIPDRSLLLWEVLVNPGASSPSKLVDRRGMARPRSFSYEVTVARPTTVFADKDDWVQIHGQDLALNSAQAPISLPSWIYRANVRCEHYIELTGMGIAGGEVEFRTLMGNTWDDPKAVGDPHHYYVSSPGSFRYSAGASYAAMPAMQQLVSQLQVRRVGNRATCLRFDALKCMATHKVHFTEQPA